MPYIAQTKTKNGLGTKEISVSCIQTATVYLGRK